MTPQHERILFVALEGWSSLMEVSRDLTYVECVHPLPHPTFLNQKEVRKTVDLDAYDFPDGAQIYVGKCPSCAKVYWCASLRRS